MSWCQELARRLARDVHRGDDAAQEAWLAAVQGGSLPRFVNSQLRGWLGRFTWNRVRERRRSETSRREREELTARPEAQESALEVLERGEVQREILDAVLSLPEPYASTVLQRYFDGLSSAEIARREEVSAEVVRKRLSRALDKLRTKLERRFHGARSLHGALALFLGPSKPSRVAPLSAGAAPFASSATSIVGWALGIFLCGAVGLWYVGGVAPVEPPRAQGPAVVNDGLITSQEAGVLIDQGWESHRRAVLAPNPRGAGDAEARAGAPTLLSGRVLEASGEPAIGAVVRGQPRDPGLESPVAESGVGGRFELSTSTTLRGIVAEKPGFATLLAVSGRDVAESESVIVIAHAIDLAGRILDSRGRALAGAQVTLVHPEGLGADLDAILDHSARRPYATRSEDAGDFILSGVPWVEGTRLQVEREGFLTASLPLPHASREGWLVTLEPIAFHGDSIEGIVLGPEDRPVEGALVSSGCETTRTGADGTFRLGSSESRCDLEPVRVTALKRGLRSASQELGTPETGSELVLRLAGRTRSIRGRVVDERGVGVSGAKVWLSDPTPFGVVGQRLAFVESLQSSDEPPLWDWVHTDAGGEFRIDGVDERSYRIAALDVATLVSGEGSARPGEEPVVVLPTSRFMSDFQGRVVDAFGTPVPGAAVTLYKRTRLVRVGEAFEWADEEVHAAVSTSREGRFQLPTVPLEGPRLRIDGAGLVPQHFALDANQLQEVQTFVVQPKTHLRVELSSENSNIDALRLLDESGKAIDLGILRGPKLVLMRQATFFGNRTHLLVVPGTARFYALDSGGSEVHRAPLRLAIGELNVVSH